MRFLPTRNVDGVHLRATLRFCEDAGSMKDPLLLALDAAHVARRLDLDADRAAIISLGARCVDYLRNAFAAPVPPWELPQMLPGLLRPSRVPLEHGLAYGIYPQRAAGSDGPTTMAGVLAVLRPPRSGGSAWCITLLLLDPAARGQGLGAAIHRAVVRWAQRRGAERLMVSVANNNPRGLHFWRDCVGYRPLALPAWKAAGNGQTSQELQYPLVRRNAPAWQRAAHRFVVR